jgi:putative peptidoglycan binding protein
MQTSKGLRAKEKNVMRILVVSICSLALVSVAVGAKKEEKKSQPKKQAQTAQRVAQPTHAAGGGASGKKASTATHQVQNNRNGRTAIAASNAQKGKKNETSTAVNQGQKGKKAQTSNTAYQTQKAKKNQSLNQTQTGKAARGGEVTRRGKATEATTATTAKGKTAQVKPVKPQHFNLAKQPNTAKAPRVKFQQGRRITGSQNWQGQQYTVFRNYRSEWHDQNWWRGHYRNNITFVFGAPYYWNAGYWFPAWGYNPNAYYAWDGPIYAYNRLPPDQVIANVQSALQQQGYYRGEVDGLIGPLTRGAIVDYQRDHGLYTTSTIDQPTLRSLGMT